MSGTAFGVEAPYSTQTVNALIAHLSEFELRIRSDPSESCPIAQ